MGKVQLKKAVYESAKISARKADLISYDEIQKLKELSFSEILKYLEEHGFRDVIDRSYLNYEGFYLIEKIFNDYLSGMYEKFFRATSKENRKFLETYYLKYQIHNLMAMLRCRYSGEKELNPYLIGEKRKKEKFLKAFEMPEEDSLIYLAKKLDLNQDELLEYNSKGLFELENYLYKQYYTSLINELPEFTKKQDQQYHNYIKYYLDLLNSRVYCILEEENLDLFKHLFIGGGNLKFKQFEGKSQQEVLSLISKNSSNKLKSPYDIDGELSIHKQRGAELFSNMSFGSPYQLLGFFLTLEEMIGSIRRLLKAKYMGVDSLELEEVMQNE